MADADDKPAAGGQGEGARELDRALLRAQRAAHEAVGVVTDIMRGGKGAQRHSGARLTAARIVLDIAGVGVAAADRRHAELLAVLRGKLSPSARSEVLRALADCTGVCEDEPAGGEAGSGAGPEGTPTVQ